MPVPLEVLRDALVREIDTQRATDDYEVEIFNRDLPLFVATGTKPELVVRNLVLDNRSNRRSEEHTSELQSLMRISYAVFCLKKKTTNTHIPHNKTTQTH